MVDPISQAMRNAQYNAVLAAQGNFVAGLQESFRQGALKSTQIQALAQALSANLIPAQKRQAAFEQMGRNAQRSVQEAFTHRRNRRQVGNAEYRARTSRYAGGKLLGAIQNSHFFKATPEGLSFINRKVLDSEARHWRRLNYGAGGIAGEGPQQFKFEMLAQVSFGLQPDPRPAFKLPPGFFIGGGGSVVRHGEGRGDAFFVRRGARAEFNTRGIEATNFLDAGVRRIANDLGPTMLGLYRDFYNDAPSRVKFEETLNVGAPRLRNIEFRRQR